MVTKFCVCFAHHRLVCSLVKIINVYVISVLPHRKESTVRKWRRRIRQEEIQGLKDLKKEKKKKRGQKIPERQRQTDHGKPITWLDLGVK